MALQLLQLPIMPSSSSPLETQNSFSCYYPKTLITINTITTPSASLSFNHQRRRFRGIVVFVGKEETESNVSIAQEEEQDKKNQLNDSDSKDLEYVQQIQRVLELLKKNRDMLFNEVKLTIMIEDPREVERLRLLGIEDPDTPTRDDLVAALEDVNEGRIPENQVALQVLAEEMLNWPNLEVEVTKKKPRKSLYAKATDTGVDPQVAAKRLNIDWDSAAEIEDADENDEGEVPSVLL